MTVVNFYRSVPQVDGSLTPATGSVRFKPTSKRVEPGAHDTVVLPKPFREDLVGGFAAAVLAPTGPSWAWEITESVDGVRDDRYWLQVPASGVFDANDLVRVHPSTLAPVVNLGGAVVDPDDPDALLIMTRPDGTVVPDPADPDALIITGS
jgi:hypothetical protein